MDLASFKITSSGGKNKISFRDDGGSLRRSEAEMVVLCPAIVPDNEAKALAVEFGIECDEQGFFKTLREKTASVESAGRGVYATGACHTPMDIRSSVNEGRAASGGILAELQTGGMIDIPPTSATVDAMRCSACMLCIPLCPYKANSSDSLTGKATIIEERCRGLAFVFHLAWHRLSKAGISLPRS
jgi:heterodisulfide reductase subunit A